MNNKNKTKLIIVIGAIALFISVILLFIFLYMKDEHRITNGEKCFQKQTEVQERQGPGTDAYFEVCRLPEDDAYQGDS